MNDTDATLPTALLTPADEAGVAVAPTGAPAPITVYWRPGCGFCRRLTAGLQGAGIVFEQVDIWEDEEAAAYVRSVARGNETVPTVRIGTVGLVNPSVATVVEVAERELPGWSADRLAVG